MLLTTFHFVYLVSLVLENLPKILCVFTDLNCKKSHGDIFGEYGGCGTIFVELFDDQNEVSFLWIHDFDVIKVIV